MIQNRLRITKTLPRGNEKGISMLHLMKVMRWKNICNGYNACKNVPAGKWSLNNACLQRLYIEPVYLVDIISNAHNACNCVTEDFWR